MVAERGSQKLFTMTNSRERFPIVPFAGVDFSTWSFRIKSILKENGVQKAIEDEDYGKNEQNSKTEAKAQAILIAGVADSHIEYLKKDTAYMMFKNLEENFKKKGVRSKLFLRRKLSEIKYSENSSLIEHFVEMEKIFTDLREADSELTEEEKVNYLLLSMPHSYDGIITALETMENLKLDFVKNRLLGEEEKKKKDSSGHQSHNTAFSCFICGKPGHKKFQCNMRDRSLSHQRGRGQGYQRGRGQGYQRGRGQDYQRGRGHGYERGRGQGYGRGHESYTADDCKSDVAFLCENSSAEAYNCNNISNDKILTWCIDSGCSDHLVNNQDVFVNYRELEFPRNIAAAKEGVMLKALGIGNIRTRCRVGKMVTTCTIKNVYYVPELRKNSLSVPKIESNGFKVTFYEGRVEIYKNDQLVMLGRANGNLYSIEMEVEQQSCYNSTEDNDSKSQLWHRRFGQFIKR